MFKLAKLNLINKCLLRAQISRSRAISTSLINGAHLRESDENEGTTHFGFETVKENEKAQKGTEII